MNKTGFLNIIGRWWWFIAIFLMIGIFGAYYASQSIEKKYTVSTKIFVTSSVDTSLANANDTLYSDRAVKTVVVFASSIPIKKALSEATSIPVDDLEEITVKNIAGTQIIDIQIAGGNKDNLLLAAQTIPSVIDAYLKNLQKDITEKNQIKASVAESPEEATTTGATALQIMALISICAFLIAYLLSYLFETMDNTIKSEKDLKRLKILHLGNFGLMKNIGNMPSAINDPNNRAAAEMMREVRTNISLSENHENLQTLVVTSSNPKEGKSFFSTNLAVMLAETGKRVVLIDCDFRSPFINRIFKVTNRKGLSDYLKNQNERDILIKSQTENLWLILAGNNLEKTSELLDIAKLNDFKNQLINVLKFDYIIFDTAPISITSDAAVLSKIADGVIVAVEKNKTTFNQIRKLQEQFNKVGGNVVGAVMTKVRNEKKVYGYYSQR